MALVIPWCRFDALSSDDETKATAREKKRDTAPGRRLLCQRCRHPITEPGQGIVFNGSHVHSRTNPAGVNFDFACYRQAPGCTVIGTPTREHSWFNGYDWQIALCGGCGIHIGWRFRGSEGFYGLVLGRLIDDSD